MAQENLEITCQGRIVEVEVIKFGSSRHLAVEHWKYHMMKAIALDNEDRSNEEQLCRLGRQTE